MAVAAGISTVPVSAAAVSLASAGSLSLALAPFFFEAVAVDVVAAMGSGTTVSSLSVVAGAVVFSVFAFFLGDVAAAAAGLSPVKAPSTPARASADSSMGDLDGAAAADLRVRLEAAIVEYDTMLRVETKAINSIQLM